MEIIKTYTKVITSGTLDQFKLLLNKEDNINEKDKFGSTLLIHCIRNNRLDMVIYLIEIGADVNLVGKDNTSPLHYAVQAQNYEIVKYLLQLDIKINTQNIDGNTPLSEALDLYIGKQTEENIIKLLLDKGANPTLSNYYGVSPLNSLDMPKNKPIRHLFSKWL